MISNKVAVRRKAYHKFDDEPEQIRIRLDPATLLDEINSRVILDGSELKALHGMSCLKLAYEQDLEKKECQQPTIDKVFQYLNLEKRKAITAHRKVNTRSQKELISNFDEIYTLLKEKNQTDFIVEVL